jgi:uncharacterized protein (UPF0335 family)
MTGIGHNRVAADDLRELVERIERLEAAKKEMLDDIKSVYDEVKANGFDVKTTRKIVAMRRMDPAGRRDEQELLLVYARAMGLDMGFDLV